MSEQCISSVCNYKYLSERKLKGFDNYKYSSVDTSPLSVYVSHPFWNQVVKLYPEWLAPNVLTLGGFSLVMSAYFLVSVLDYEMYAASDDYTSYSPVPDWVWLYTAVCTFLGHVLDGTDGKQARRTGTSGPTGEMFDHGLDSWATLPFTVTIFSAFGRTLMSLPPVRLLCVLISVQMVFIATHWEKYNTGVLFLSWGYDLSQYGLVIFYLATWVLGYKTWQFWVLQPYGISCAVVFEIFFYVVCVASLLVSSYNMYISYCVTKTGLQSTVNEGARPMYPFVALSALSVFWACYSPNKVCDLDPRAFIWLNGTLFSNIACRLIVSQMTGTRAQAWNHLLSVLSVCIGLSTICNAFMELWLMRLCSVAVTIAHLHFGICVVNQLCDHLNIRAFSIGANASSRATATCNDANKGHKSQYVSATKTVEMQGLLPLEPLDTDTADLQL